MAHGIGRQMWKFLLRFLDAVLAERANAGRVGEEQVGERIRLPDRDEEDAILRPAAPRGGRRDAPLHIGDARGDLLGPRHGVVIAPSPPGAGRIERAVREGVRLAVLLARDVYEAEAFDPARFPPSLLEECGEVRRLHAVLAGELAEDELAVGADLDIPGARRERDVESREKATPFRDVVGRGMAWLS